MRILKLLLITLGAGILLIALKLWLADRQQLATWTRVTARIDSTRVVDAPAQLPYSIGGKAPLLAMTYEVNGKTYRGKFVEGVWARRTYMRAREDAREAETRRSMEILVDPLDAYHISLKPDDWVFYYRDAWQLLLCGSVLMMAGVLLPGRR